jgi:drug/metabolite transporter (DMT)-like permease
MSVPSSLWIAFTIAGAGGQVARNAMQRSLTQTLGTIGATHVRFLFGFPFALVFLTIVLTVTGETLPRPAPSFWPWLLIAAVAQIAGTALMLAAMAERSFVVTTAYLKTEPIQAAIFGFVFLADVLTPWKVAAIAVATLGVVITALRPGSASTVAGLRPTLMGLAAAALFALSAVGFRGAILALSPTNFVVAATVTLAVGLFVQAALLTLWLALHEPPVLRAIVGAWRPSLLAGLTGALASQCWFLAFALTPAANVRTLALIEVVFAQGVAYYKFRQRLSAREMIGIVMIVAGAGWLIAL